MLQGTGGPVPASRARAAGGGRRARRAAPRSPSSPAARPTSSPARWACRATPSRPPRRSCARSRPATAGSSGSAGPTTGGSRSTPGWAGTPTWSPRSSRCASAGWPPPRCATRRPRCASTTGSGAIPKPMTVEVPGVLEPTEVRVAFVSNTSTWTYLGSRAGAHQSRGVVRHRPGPVRDAEPRHRHRRATCLHEILRAGGDPRGRHVVRHDAVPLVRVSWRSRWRCSWTATTSASAPRSSSSPYPRRYASWSDDDASSRQGCCSSHQRCTTPANPGNARSVRRFRRTVELQRARTWRNDAPRWSQRQGATAGKSPAWSAGAG